MIAETLRTLALAIGSASRPAAFVSFGKDSMAMLGLLREAGLLTAVDLVTFRHPAFLKRYRFADGVIAAWSLRPRIFYHGWNSIIAGNGRVDLVGTVRVRNAEIHLPVATMVGRPSEEGVSCALDNEIAEGIDLVSLDFDLVLVGTKRCDVDPVVGAVQVRRAFEDNVGGPAVLFPLCDWTETDVWGYLLDRDIPFDTARYLGDSPESMVDDSGYQLHPEYLPVCTACLNPALGSEVLCPKAGAMIPSRAHCVPRRRYPPPQRTERPEIVAL